MARCSTGANAVPGGAPLLSSCVRSITGVDHFRGIPCNAEVNGDCAVVLYAGSVIERFRDWSTEGDMGLLVGGGGPLRMA